MTMEYNDQHWYSAPSQECVVCGLPITHDVHLKRCGSIVSNSGPGFMFCGKPTGHEERGDDVHQGPDWRGETKKWKTTEGFRGVEFID